MLSRIQYGLWFIVIQTEEMVSNLNITASKKTRAGFKLPVAVARVGEPYFIPVKPMLGLKVILQIADVVE